MPPTSAAPPVSKTIKAAYVSQNGYDRRSKQEARMGNALEQRRADRELQEELDMLERLEKEVEKEQAVWVESSNRVAVRIFGDDLGTLEKDLKKAEKLVSNSKSVKEGRS